MRFCRCEMLIGADALENLKNSSVAVFGVGGVGGYVVEALTRSGVGRIAIIDKDVVDESNINRQIVALTSTIGKNKVDVMKQRMLDINPDVKVEAHCEFYLPDNADFIELGSFDYVVDAIDNVTAKIELIKRCKQAGVPIISAMGAGNKLDPTRIEIADISKTSVCPLAKVIRRKLADLGIEGVTVAYTREIPANASGGRTPASMMPVPAAMGLTMASKVLRDLSGMRIKSKS